jgi:hypothetical protein
MATGGDLEDVRYRIISVTLLGLQGVLLHEFVVARRYTPISVLTFLATILFELLSVTRSLLVGTVLLFVIALAMSAPSAQHMWRAVTRGLLVGAVLAGVAGVAALSFPTVADHWTQRIFASEETKTGKDPTTITRLAEMRDQYDQVTQSPETVLFGEGYGHYYRYSPLYLPDLAGQISEQDFYAINEWAAGHNFWVYQFFAGGLLFGIGMPLATLAALAVCFFAYRHWRSVVPDAPLLPVLGRAIMLFAALPATSIGGNPLGPRFSGLVFGVALGLMVATYARLQRALPARTKRAPRPRPPRRGMMPEQSDRSYPGMGRPDLPAALGMTRTVSDGAPDSSGSNHFGAIVPHNAPRQHSNRPNIAR